MAMESDAHGAPTVVALARYRFYLIERDGRLALRIKDTEAPTRRDFRGIDHFPFDPAWMLYGHWDGNVARFVLQAQACALRPQRSDARPLQFVFGDRTNGRETYGDSMIVNPWGEILARRAQEPGVVVAPCDLQKLKSLRAQLPSIEHRRIR